ncbi:hypothetical protein [Pedobacter borealis]|uniref:hypothetical protein n=1 Tax=Pedobacter borealis TaxID=475254 RepID=UPI0004930986|nr:hypothetical protein [Pedobacter borealis]
MELQPIKPRRAVRFRSKQEIMNLLEKYESLEKQTSLIKFCKDHAVPTATFHTWLKHRRAGKYGVHGKFIALSVEQASPVTAAAPLPVFASINSGELTVQLHQYVGPEYIQSILDKRRGL